MTVCAVRVRLPHENDDLAARVGRAGRVPLAAVDHIFVAVPDDEACDVGCVGRGDVRLGHREGRTDFPGEQRLQPSLLLRFGPVAQDRLHVAGVGRAAVEHFRREMRTSHDLAQRRVFKIGQAALGGRKEEVPQTRGPGERLELLDHRKNGPRTEPLGFLIEAPLVRIDVRGHELENPRAQLRAARALADIHSTALLFLFSERRRARSVARAFVPMHGHASGQHDAFRCS